VSNGQETTSPAIHQARADSAQCLKTPNLENKEQRSMLHCAPSRDGVKTVMRRFSRELLLVSQVAM
jgi:hypothetical protein